MALAGDPGTLGPRRGEQDRPEVPPGLRGPGSPLLSTANRGPARCAIPELGDDSPGTRP